MPLKKHEAEKLIAVIRDLAEPDASRVAEVRGMGPRGEPQGAKLAQDPPAPSVAAVDFEVLYQKIKRRLLDELRIDPVFVKLLATQPEIMVEIEPRVVELEGASLKGRIARLMAAGWFKEPRKSGTVRGELARTGSDPGSGGRLSEALTEYVNQGFLTREGDAYVLAPGVKVSEKVLAVA